MLLTFLLIIHQGELQEGIADKIISRGNFRKVCVKKIVKIKKIRLEETLSLLTCADNSIMSKKKCWSNSEHLTLFKALCGDDLDQNMPMTVASSPEHLPVIKTPCVTIWN